MSAPSPFSVARLIGWTIFGVVIAAITATYFCVALPYAMKAEANALLYEGLGNFKKAQFKHAVAEIEQAVALDPKIHVPPHDELGRAFLGWAHMRVKEYDAAGKDFDEALKLRPNTPTYLFARGYVYEKQDDYAKALASYQQVLRSQPESSEAYNDIAWLLSTCPDEKARDGKRAVTTATQACELSGWKNPASVDTLAAAYAEAGDFDNAVKWENAALMLPGFSDSVAADARTRLALYQAHKPYHRDQDSDD